MSRTKSSGNDRTQRTCGALAALTKQSNLQKASGSGMEVFAGATLFSDFSHVKDSGDSSVNIGQHRIMIRRPVRLCFDLNLPGQDGGRDPVPP
jgi:hypothetical protein